MPPKNYQSRETWLADAMDRLGPHFERCGYEIPSNVRVACGLPSVGAFATKRRVGEAWSSTASRDKHHEIFISPTIDDPLIVLGTLVHELVHVTVGLKAGHRGAFIECARAVGLAGPWTATSATDELIDGQLKPIIRKLGPYPHGTLSKMSNGKKKQSTRLIKCGCASCGYVTRISMMWILQGVPSCPNENCDDYGKPFEVEAPAPDDE